MARRARWWRCCWSLHAGLVGGGRLGGARDDDGGDLSGTACLRPVGVEPQCAGARPSSCLVIARPLAVVDPGLVLSVGATAAIIVLGRASGRQPAGQRVAAHGGRRGGGVAGDRTGAVAGVGDASSTASPSPVCCSTWRRCRLMAVVQVAASLTVLAHPVAPVAASAFGLVDGVGRRRAGRQRQAWWTGCRGWPCGCRRRRLGGRVRTCSAWPALVVAAAPAGAVTSSGARASGGAVSAVADGVRDLDRHGAVHLALAVARRRPTAGRRTRRRAGRRDAGGVSRRLPLARRCRRPARVGDLRHRRARGRARRCGRAGPAGSTRWC